MLNIYLGEMEQAIYYPPAYFDNQYEDEWIIEPLSVEMIKDVDRSEVIIPHLIESPVLGPISVKEISGGVKTLILLAFDQSGKVFNASACGDNCAKWILQIGKEKELTINLRHLMDFGAGGFEIKKNITIIQGDSATGKTTLINMIRQAENLGPSSGIEVTCNVPCRVLEGANWKLILENSSHTIFFTDEENQFINTEEFVAAVRDSDNYHVLITRENLYNLPYSVEEIYGIHCSGKYYDTRKMYQQMYQICSKYQQLPVIPEKIITEDSNSGYDFFKAVGLPSQERFCSSISFRSSIAISTSNV